MSSHLDYEINKELGECYLFMGELEKSESYYLKALDSNNKLAAPYLGLATIAIQRNNYDDALVYYKKAYSIDKYNDKPITGIGLVFMEKNQLADAFGKFQEALAINAGNMIALSCLVRIAYMTNKVEEIIPFLERGVEHDENQSTRITLAGCYISLDRHKEATSLLKEALLNEPNNAEAHDLLKHVQSLAA